MEYKELNDANLVDKPQKNLKGKSLSNFELNPKLVAILLVVNLVFGILNLAGIGYLSFKDVNRNQMIRSFPNGGNFSPPNGQMFDNQQQQQPSNTN